MADLARVLHLLQRAECLFFGHFGIEAVQLVQVDGFQLQAAQAHLDALR